jgi:hypothetical protein
LKVMPCRFRKRHAVLRATCRPCSRPSGSTSSTMVMSTWLAMALPLRRRTPRQAPVNGRNHPRVGPSIRSVPSMPPPCHRSLDCPLCRGVRPRDPLAAVGILQEPLSVPYRPANSQIVVQDNVAALPASVHRARTPGATLRSEYGVSIEPDRDRSRRSAGRIFAQAAPHNLCFRLVDRTFAGRTGAVRPSAARHSRCTSRRRLCPSRCCRVDPGAFCLTRNPESCAPCQNTRAEVPAQPDRDVVPRQSVWLPTRTNIYPASFDIVPRQPVGTGSVFSQVRGGSPSGDRVGLGYQRFRHPDARYIDEPAI